VVRIDVARDGGGGRQSGGSRLNGRWRCITNGNLSEYWQISQNGNRVTATLTDSAGGAATITGVRAGNQVNYYSSGGALGTLQIDGGSMHGSFNLSCGASQTKFVCTRN
jgi:hypothetical protein